MGLVLLIASSTPAHAGYTEPGQSGSLLGEAFAFVGDFSQWNAVHNDLPMTLLEFAPANEKGDAVLLLFWFWLHDPLAFPGGGNLSSPLPGSTSTSNPSLPNSSSGSDESPIGTISMGQSGNGLPVSFSNGGGDNHLGNVNNAGNGPPSSPSNSGGNTSSLDGDNSGSSLGLNDPTSQNGGGNNSSLGGNNLGSGLGLNDPAAQNGLGNNSSSGGSNSVSSLGLNDPPPQNGGGNNGHPLGGGPSAGALPVYSSGPVPAAVPVPEPASLTLLGIGGIGLLVGRRLRLRKPCSKALRQLASVP